MIKASEKAIHGFGKTKRYAVLLFVEVVIESKIHSSQTQLDQMTLTDKIVLSSSYSSANNLSLVIVRESSIGTIGNRLLRSKLTILSSSLIGRLVIMFIKCVEFLIYNPTSGDIIWDSSWASWYVGELMVEIISLKGIYGSWEAHGFVETSAVEVPGIF